MTGPNWGQPELHRILAELVTKTHKHEGISALNILHAYDEVIAAWSARQPEVVSYDQIATVASKAWLEYHGALLGDDRRSLTKVIVAISKLQLPAAAEVPVPTVEEVLRHLHTIERLAHYENNAPLWEVWSDIQVCVSAIKALLTKGRGGAV